MMAKIAIRPAGQIQELVQVQQHAGEPHHRQRGQIGVELAADLGHFRTAVADGLNLRAALPQLPDQVGPVQIAAGLADREKNRWRFGWLHGEISNPGFLRKYRKFPKLTEGQFRGDGTSALVSSRRAGGC